MFIDLEGLRTKLGSIEGLRLLILFGSLVEGVSRKDSDVDIVVDCDEGAFEALNSLLSKELGGRETHILKAGWLKPETLLQIAKKGSILIDRDVLANLLAGVPCDYFELKEELDRTFDSWLKGNPVDARTILSIVRQVDEDVGILKGLSEKLDQVLADPIQRRAFERSLHTAMEGMFDILRHIVSRIAPGGFETYGELINVAENLGIISTPTWSLIRGLVDARHTLVHRYRGVTDRFLEEHLNKVCTSWPSFKEEVRGYLQKLT